VRGSKIVKRGKDSYSFRYDLPPGPDGKRQQKTETVKGSYKDAERRLRELLSQIDSGKLSWTPVRKTLGECLDEYLDNIKGGNDNTQATYVTAFKAFRRQLGQDTVVSSLDRELVQAAVNRLRDDEGMEKSTLGLYFSKFHIAMRWACLPTVRHTMQDPCIGVKISRPDRQVKQVWEDDQSNQFIRFCKAYAARYSKFYRYLTLFPLLLASGARVGEILSLRWPDVDLGKMSIHIYKTVSDKGKYGPPKSKNGFREVPLDEGAMRLLARHKVSQDKEKLAFGEGYNPDNLVFTTARGRRVIRESALMQFMRTSEKAGVPYITIHGLRHTNATMLLRNGMSVNAVAERLGDNPATIYETYGHVTPRMQSESVRIIAQAYQF
jgi:integrase